jgi:hypothetical protein
MLKWGCTVPCLASVNEIILHHIFIISRYARNSYVIPSIVRETKFIPIDGQGYSLALYQEVHGVRNNTQKGVLNTKVIIKCGLRQEFRK